MSMDSKFRGEPIIQSLDYVWFFSNVLASPSPIKTKTKPANQNRDSILDSQPNKPATTISQTQPIQPPNSTLAYPDESGKSTYSYIRSFHARTSRKCFKVQEEEEKRMQMKKQRIIKKRRELTVESEIDFEVLMMGLGGLSFEEVLPRMYYKDDKAMKRHLRLWAHAIASNVAQNNDFMLAACS